MEELGDKEAPYDDLAAHGRRAPAGEGSPTDGGPSLPPGGLPCALIRDIHQAGETPWLVEGMWTAQGVGIVGGTPKTGKTWLALDIALSVASGTDALGHFPVSDPGPVLLYPAEDGPGAIRGRIEGLARARGVQIQTLPLHVITADSLRLDDDEDRVKLEQLLEALSPRLLVLDPLVRLHAGDENHTGHIAQLLGYLRRLQRRFSLAIMITHHVAKQRGSSVQPGQALRGSSDLHAWGDSNAYLQKQKNGSVLLTLEHRAAPAPDPLLITLISQPGGGARFEIGEVTTDEEVPRATAARGTPQTLLLEDRVLALLRNAAEPISQVVIRKRLRVRNATLTEVLRALVDAGLIQSLGRMGGWRLVRARRAQPGTLDLLDELVSAGARETPDKGGASLRLPEPD